jgi:iron(III) transport system ATP-binding protein
MTTTLGSRGSTDGTAGGLRLDGLRVHFRGTTALDGIDLQVNAGDLVVLLGPSGCGKTTTLNSVAGVLRPSSGHISLDGRVLFDATRRINVAPNKRNLGMVFQSYALWPHMTVGDCVAFPLRMRGVARDEQRRRVGAALQLLQCEELVGRYPAELSGGQQQRVALGRAIVAEPDLLLFDEPLSNLDTKLREGLRAEIAKLHQRLSFTGLYVTHDRAEAFALGTVLVVMRHGRIVQVGRPREVYERPADLDTARFLGAITIDGIVEAAHDGGPVVRTAFGSLRARSAVGREPATIAIHPERIRLREDSTSAAVVSLVRFLGSRWEYDVTAGDLDVVVSQPIGSEPIQAGAHVALEASPDDVLVYERERPDATSDERRDLPEADDGGDRPVEDDRRTERTPVEAGSSPHPTRPTN